MDRFPSTKTKSEFHVVEACFFVHDWICQYGSCFQGSRWESRMFDASVSISQHKKTPPGPGAAGPRLSKIKKYIEVHQECQLWAFQAKRSTVNPSGQVHVCQVSAYLHDKYRRYLDTCLRGQVSKAVWAQFLSRQTGTVLHKLATEGWRPGMVNLINVPFEEWQLN